MESMIFEGKTTEEAIQNASRQLNTPPEDLDFDIIEPGSAGIFGLVGIKKAKIKVHYSPAREEAAEVETEPESFEEPAEEEVEDIFSETFPEAATSPAREEAAAEETEEEGAEEEAGGEDVRVSREVLEKILELIPMEATVRAGRREGNINLNIEGDNSGLLIGRRGKTLDSLQFIVNKIVNKNLDKKVRIVVDSEKYRQRRKESLTQMAERMGEKAKRIRKPITTNPMNPGDRRIVHLALKNDGQLDTRSRGEGLMKKVVIIPKR